MSFSQQGIRVAKRGAYSWYQLRLPRPHGTGTVVLSLLLRWLAAVCNLGLLRVF